MLGGNLGSLLPGDVSVMLTQLKNYSKVRGVTTSILTLRKYIEIFVLYIRWLSIKYVDFPYNSGIFLIF